MIIEKSAYICLPGMSRAGIRCFNRFSDPFYDRAIFIGR